MTTEIQPSDQDLWSAITEGDELAFGQLFDRYAKRVYNHAFRLTGSWTAAQDITQETFLVAWRRRADAHLVDGSALPWLLVVATTTTRTERGSVRRWPRSGTAGSPPSPAERNSGVSSQPDGHLRTGDSTQAGELDVDFASVGGAAGLVDHISGQPGPAVVGGRLGHRGHPQQQGPITGELRRGPAVDDEQVAGLWSCGGHQ